MNKITIICVMSVVMVFFIIKGSIAGPEDNVAKRNAVLKHADKIKDQYKGNDSNGIWMNKFIEKVDGESLSDEEWSRAISILVVDSQKGKFKQGGSDLGFVQDEQTVDILVTALKDKNRIGREFAVDTLTWRTVNNIRNKYAKEIREELGPRPELREEMFLFAKCGLTSLQKRELLTWNDVPAPVRALCGDLNAENKLIFEFKESDDYFEKAKLSRQLAYIGTHACVVALIDGLQSSTILETPYETCSIRIEIIESLGIIYNEEKIFTTDAKILKSNSDEVFDQRCGLNDYIKEVDHWVLNKFGHSAWNSDNVWFKRVKNVPIVNL